MVKIHEEMFNIFIKETRIKSTLHLTLVKIAIINNTNNNKCQEGFGEKRTLTYHWKEYKLEQPLWKSVWRFLKN
jgi:hypothetical protein